MEKIKLFDEHNRFRCDTCKKRTQHHYKKPYSQDRRIIICNDCGKETIKERPLMIGDLNKKLFKQPITLNNDG